MNFEEELQMALLESEKTLQMDEENRNLLAVAEFASFHQHLQQHVAGEDEGNDGKEEEEKNPNDEILFEIALMESLELHRLYADKDDDDKGKEDMDEKINDKFLMDLLDGGHINDVQANEIFEKLN
jgi:hypothetical protein